jgi:hypothetical protein
MTAESLRDISGLISAWGSGDENALRSLMPLVYPELRRIARRRLGRCQAGHSLESAALANEAYLNLVRAGGIRCEGRVHFLALCSQIIRRILGIMRATVSAPSEAEALASNVERERLRLVHAR